MKSVVENNHTADHEQSFTEEAFNTTVETEESNMPLETEQTSNGLENFGVDEDAAPDLFSSDNEQMNQIVFYRQRIMKITLKMMILKFQHF